jgi:hypothetical protein
MGGLGSVLELWRYPVKSMQGERLAEAVVSQRGVLGDRAFALIDRREGRVASAKQPRKWAALLSCHAAFVEPPSQGRPLPPAEITLPDGSVTRSDAPDVDAVLSGFVGRDVSLATVAPDNATLEEWWPDIEGLAPAEHIEAGRIHAEHEGEVVTDEAMGLVSPPGTFFDCGPLHLITDATLAELGRHHSTGHVNPRRFRPNVVVGSPDRGFVENNWLGHTLQIGAGVTLSIALPAPRCVMTTLAQPDIGADRSVLQIVAATNRVTVEGLGTWSCAGIYATVVEGGTMVVGDQVVRTDAGESRESIASRRRSVIGDPR